MHEANAKPFGSMGRALREAAEQLVEMLSPPMSMEKRLPSQETMEPPRSARPPLTLPIIGSFSCGHDDLAAYDDGVSAFSADKVPEAADAQFLLHHELGTVANEDAAGGAIFS